MKSKVSVYKLYSLSRIVCFENIRGSAELKWAPCGPFHPQFDMLAIEKVCAKHARFNL
jgi:hypothetical protein